MKVILYGGSHHGRVIHIQQGSSVLMVSSGETYERPKPPKVVDGVEMWRLVQITEKASEAT